MVIPVLDAVYGRETPLVRDARANGLVVADGLDLLVAQAIPQFERMTGRRHGPQRWAAAAHLRWVMGHVLLLRLHSQQDATTHRYPRPRGASGRVSCSCG